MDHKPKINLPLSFSTSTELMHHLGKLDKVGHNAY